MYRYLAIGPRSTSWLSQCALAAVRGPCSMEIHDRFRDLDDLKSQLDPLSQSPSTRLSEN